jgi:sec-independent protein translocase protein TatC
MPVILWQIWQFVSPGLYKHERRYALPFVGSAITLFIMGAYIAYWTLPKALQWLADIGGNNITQAYTADKYFQLIAYMMLAFGIGFEFPILLIFLQMAGIVQTATLRKYWRHAIVVIAIVVAVATPSNDPFSMLALSVPMWLFYGIAVLFGTLRDRRRRRVAAKQA